MVTLLWILAVILVIAGIVTAVRGQVLSGSCSWSSGCWSVPAASASSPDRRDTAARCGIDIVWNPAVAVADLAPLRVHDRRHTAALGTDLGTGGAVTRARGRSRSAP